MKTVTVTTFKAQCLALLEKLPEDGVLITKHGRLIARVMPYREGNGELIGALAGKISIEGDLESTGVAWNANGQS